MLASLFAVAAALASPVTAAAVGGAVAPRAEISTYNASPVQFSWPVPRSNWTAANAAVAPCGGAALGTRTSYPLSGGDIALAQLDTVANLAIMYSKDADPSRFHSFSTYTGSISELGAGQYCTKGPAFDQLGFKEGDVATIMVFYQLTDTTSKAYYYQCADVTLVASANYVAASEYTCGNTTEILNVATGNDSVTMKAFSASADATATGAAHGSTSSAASGSSSGSSSGATGLAVSVPVIAAGVAAAMMCL